MQKVTPFLWFDDKAEEAAEFYVDVFNSRPAGSKESKVQGVSRYGEEGPGTPGTAMTASFILEGHEFTALNGGPEFAFTEATSFHVSCESQDEVDHFWKALTDGGEESQCGWLKDRYGLSWQIIPTALHQLLGDPDPAESGTRDESDAPDEQDRHRRTAARGRRRRVGSHRPSPCRRSRSRLEDLLRELAPQVLGALVRRHGQFDACEDAVQEALLAAAQQWPQAGVPDNPRSWLLTVATRRLVDEWRSESARRRRDETVAAMEPPDPGQPSEQDDTLPLVFLCCHPSLSEPSQLALTLRAVGGLTTAEIGNAFLVPEATMAQRISRAKQSIKSSGVPFDLPPEPERADRLRVVMHVLYLIFNEGYTASAGAALQRADLTTEAIRLTRLLHQLMPAEGEVAGLLALMLLTDARRAARTKLGRLSGSARRTAT